MVKPCGEQSIGAGSIGGMSRVPARNVRQFVQSSVLPKGFMPCVFGLGRTCVRGWRRRRRTYASLHHENACSWRFSRSMDEPMSPEKGFAGWLSDETELRRLGFGVTAVVETDG